jgi:hypothetical protein
VYHIKQAIYEMENGEFIFIKGFAIKNVSMVVDSRKRFCGF